MRKKFDIESRQFAAIKRRLASGRTLTAAQMKFVETYNAKKIAASAPLDSDIASGVTDLARRLGVHRQVITWHRGRADAPKHFSISAWRGYLLTHGKGATIGRVESSSPQRDTRKQVVEESALAQFHAVSNALPSALDAALRGENISVLPSEFDRIVIDLWLRLAAAQQATAELQGLVGIFDPDEEGACYPSGIVEICSRISAKTETQNPQSEIEK